MLSAAAYETLSALAPAAARVAEGLTVSDTPRGRRQRLTPAARRARAEFGEQLAAALAALPVLDIRGNVAEAVGLAAVEAAVTAETRDEELPGIAERLRAQVVPARPGDYVVLDHCLSQLAGRRHLARAGVRDRLAVTARLASGDRRERDALLRRVKGWDDDADSYRGLGELVGMSHTQVRAIVRQAVDDRDDEDERWEQEEAAADERRAYTRRKNCSACGKPSRRLVRRYQPGRTIIQADDDDPSRDQYGHVTDLDESPRYSLQPSWAVCGTACARKVIEEDRAAPKGSWVPGRQEFYYCVESFRYVPHDTELPRPLRQLRNSTDLTADTRERLERAVAAGDAAGAALHLASLRRDIAHAAAALAAIRTHTPAPRVFAPGDPAPGDDVLQVRIADTIYRHWPVISPHVEGHWTGPSGQRRTWDELTEAGGGALTEIPRERVVLPGRDDDQD